MVVAKYPATHGHTTVINNLCINLQKLGYKTGIGAFSFEKNPPSNIEKIKLNKSKLLFYGVNYLDFDIIHSHQSRVNYYLLLVKPTKPIVQHYHGASNKIQEKNFQLMMKLYRNRINKIVSVSKAGISQMKKMVNNINADVVYNGVDTKFFNTNLPRPYHKGEPQLLFVSALRKYKNTDKLILAMPKILEIYPKAHLQIVGDGEEISHLNNLICKTKMENHIELTGKVSNDELKLYYSSCDIYISASAFEVCPVPTLEAMACGKPLVLFDIEPHQEIIEQSQAGLIFSNSSEDIAKQVHEIYSNKESYGKHAQIFAKNHDWGKISLQMSEIYQKL
ncbi:MAG: glycosyltransferase family 1 protein [Crenarchaeota archaeon]|nr:MAG: glycosyltransferase family 1 protein [Thermoproteota archaeon]RDJ33331.1 MAG: glycosyltransferase family 1 protein [Thermoproteota archaeon]RDJ36166.1 MAG: glycosyltransferase family 1 protein [Thermoproteota archaeon]RDJ38797.1 MAG: glycosyltransferase family 1 protein [Thermoproteota archaeon]